MVFQGTIEEHKVGVTLINCGLLGGLFLDKTLNLPTFDGKLRPKGGNFGGLLDGHVSH